MRYGSTGIVIFSFFLFILASLSQSLTAEVYFNVVAYREENEKKNNL